jgi:hypothetical protein
MDMLTSITTFPIGRLFSSSAARRARDTGPVSGHRSDELAAHLVHERAHARSTARSTLSRVAVLDPWIHRVGMSAACRLPFGQPRPSRPEGVSCACFAKARQRVPATKTWKLRIS